MGKSFRQAFLDAMQSSDQTIAMVAKGTGVAENHLRALERQDETRTNLADATRIAAHFGASLDVFLGDPALKAPLELVSLYSQLPEHLKRQFLAYGLGPTEDQDHSGQV